MWALGAIGNAVYATAAYTGLVSSEDVQPPYPCAWPLQEVPEDPQKAIAMSLEIGGSVAKLLEEKEFQLCQEYVDPEAAEGGDIRLWARPQIGRYHMVKITMSFRDTPPEKIISLIASLDLPQRQKFSPDCTEVTSVVEYSPTCRVVIHKFWSPPPVAHREFCFLTNNSVNPDGSQCVWGCSVNCSKCPDGSGYVRGACMWGWLVVPVGPHCMITYVNCLDPRGWTPSFAFAWLKNHAVHEFVRIRCVIYGKELKSDRDDLESCGFTQEQMKEALNDPKTAPEAAKEDTSKASETTKESTSK